jgi:uncharacterized membrane protein
MRQDPDNYKWGIIYFNHKDARIIVPKRNPYMGLTLNFANPYSYLILVLLIGVIKILVNVGAIQSHSPKIF